VQLEDKYISMCEESYIPAEMKTDLENLIKARIKVLMK